MNSTKQLAKAGKHWTWKPLYWILLPLNVIPWTIGLLLSLGDWIMHGNELHLLNQAEDIEGADVMLQHGGSSVTIDCAKVSAEDTHRLLSDASHIQRDLHLMLIHVTSDIMPLVTRLSGLVDLDISESDIGNVDLLHLGNLSQLDALDVSGTRVTDDGLRALASLKSLAWLDLSDTQVTDAGLEHLSGLTHLESIRVQDTNVTSQAMEQFSNSVSRNVEFVT
ncbi:MAG: hypothetical protein ACR2NP_17030 [Pirellulaceae bacterium]